MIYSRYSNLSLTDYIQILQALKKPLEVAFVKCKQ